MSLEKERKTLFGPSNSMDVPKVCAILRVEFGLKFFLNFGWGVTSDTQYVVLCMLLFGTRNWGLRITSEIHYCMVQGQVQVEAKCCGGSTNEPIQEHLDPLLCIIRVLP